PSHILLDAFTKTGIPIKKDKKGKWICISLTDLKYNNPVLNSLAILAGIIMLMMSLIIISNNPVLNGLLILAGIIMLMMSLIAIAKKSYTVRIGKNNSK
ncbi:MAG: hypothetical protein QXY60_08415, partial [Saccharolobus sp.]